MPNFYDIPIPDTYKMQRQIATSNSGTMTIEHALVMMRVARPDLRDEPCALNAGISTIQAWDIVWKVLVKMKSEEKHRWTGTILDTKQSLAPWLEKRVRQVCTNRVNLDLEHKPSKPVPPTPPTDPRPVRKRKPYERKFS